MANIVRTEFITHMQGELDAHAHMGDFSDYKISDGNSALFWLHHHEVLLAKSIFSADTAGVRNHCADLANIAMKIEEQYGPASLQQVTEPLPGIVP